jgi:hypothetical protein
MLGGADDGGVGASATAVGSRNGSPSRTSKDVAGIPE